MIEVLMAFKEGKEIERRVSADYWVSLSDNHFDFTQQEYRIKPQPEYIPFTHLDYELFMNKIIIDGGGKRQIILAFDDCDITTTRSNFGYARAFEVFKFINGTPFGKLKQ